MKRINGWIFDVYADAQGMTVWVIDAAGIAHQLHDTLSPSFFVFGPNADLHAVCVMLSAAHLPVRLRRAERHDLFLRHDLTLLEVQVMRPLLFASIFSRVRTFRPALSYYDADLTPAQFYYFEKDLFPLAYCEIQADASGWITGMEVRDSLWELDYRLPPLKTMSVRSFSSWALLIVAVAGLVLFFRLYQLNQVPSEMVSDQAEKLLDIWDVLNGQPSIFFPRNTGREAFQMYLTAGSSSCLAPVTPS